MNDSVERSAKIRLPISNLIYSFAKLFINLSVGISSVGFYISSRNVLLTKVQGEVS